jgi:hypothetical protein
MESKYLTNKMGMNNNKWKEYTKFTFVRNPYTRFISGYKNLLKLYKKPIMLEEIIKSKNSWNMETYCHLFIPQTKHIIDKNKKIFINIIKYQENLEMDFLNILYSFNFKFMHNNSKLNEGEITTYNLSDQVIKFINSHFYQDFINFNYKMLDYKDNIEPPISLYDKNEDDKEDKEDKEDKDECKKCKLRIIHDNKQQGIIENNMVF